jgi:hypothetical protein
MTAVGRSGPALNRGTRAGASPGRRIRPAGLPTVGIDATVSWPAEEAPVRRTGGVRCVNVVWCSSGAGAGPRGHGSDWRMRVRGWPSAVMARGISTARCPPCWPGPSGYGEAGSPPDAPPRRPAMNCWSGRRRMRLPRRGRSGGGWCGGCQRGGVCGRARCAPTPTTSSGTSSRTRAGSGSLSSPAATSPTCSPPCPRLRRDTGGP